eukprot:1860837-Rhodomonas_salina.1
MLAGVEGDGEQQGSTTLRVLFLTAHVSEVQTAPLGSAQHPIPDITSPPTVKHQQHARMDRNTSAPQPNTRLGSHAIQRT